MVLNEFLDWMCVNVRKEDENDTSCTYSFTCLKYRELEAGRSEAAGPVTGQLSIRKSDGKLKLLVPMPGDHEQRVVARAAQVIIRHWRNGEYPNSTAHIAG
jgi:hypothetical protein